MSWTFCKAADFNEVKISWDTLNRLCGNHVLLDSAFVGPLVRHFGSPELQLGIGNSPHSGMALLRRDRFSSWSTFQPSQAPLGLLLLPDESRTGEAIWQMLRDLPGFALHLSVLQQDPDFSSLNHVHSRPGVQRVDYIETARLPIEGSFEDYWSNRGKNLRHNLGRQRRRLAEKGHVLELVRISQPGGVAAAIREYGRLESQGWKAQEGTAVALDNRQGQFYREVFEVFCDRGEGIVFQYLLDGKIVASDLCLIRGGMLVVLKTAYDEGNEGFSPALLMRQDIVRELHEQKSVHVIEFYGRVRDWHTKWTTHVRTMYHLNLFRSPAIARTRMLLKRFL